NSDFQVVFSVSVDAAVQGGFDVAISSLGLTAASGTDQKMDATGLHFTGAAGESHDVTVTIKGDTVVEANETFSVTLGDVTGTTATQDAAITTGASATGTINIGDSATLSITAPSITETNSDFQVVFSVSVDAAVQGGFDVAISSLGLTAASGTRSEVGRVGQHCRGAAGESHDVTVTIKGHAVVEGKQTFSVTLGDVTGTTATQDAAITTGGPATGTINDCGTEVLSIALPSITETNSDFQVVFSVSVDAAVQGGFDVAISSLGLTAASGTDYTRSEARREGTGAAGGSDEGAGTSKGDTVVGANEKVSGTPGGVTGRT